MTSNWSTSSKNITRWETSAFFLMSHNSTRAILSPCIGICVLDEQGLCEGCHRTGNEIGSWSAYNDAQRAHIMDTILPKRELQRLSCD